MKSDPNQLSQENDSSFMNSFSKEPEQDSFSLAQRITKMATNESK